jgi:phosphoribosylformylglycinamidine synthase
VKRIRAKVAVVRFPGSNCDLDAVSALRTFPGVDADLIWHEEPSIGKYDAIVLPGGFAFGDYLRAGAIAARSPAMERVAECAARGKPVLGICNGFQTLIEGGLLPGSLLRNSSLRFVCKWVAVRVENDSTCFTRGLKKGQVLRIPIAHNEGRFYASKECLREMLEDQQVVFRYCDEDGEPTPSANPTGTMYGIAGVCNREGNVVGLMPHPERATDSVLSPTGSTDGSLIFRSMLEAI